MCHRMMWLLCSTMIGWYLTWSVRVSCDIHVIRSYRSVGDETFMRAFETATLGYEEWTHEVRSPLSLDLLCAVPWMVSLSPGPYQDGMELPHTAWQGDSDTYHQVGHPSIPQTCINLWYPTGLVSSITLTRTMGR